MKLWEGRSISLPLRQSNFWGEKNLMFIYGDNGLCNRRRFPWIRYSKGLGRHIAPQLLLKRKGKHCILLSETNRIVYFHTHCCEGDCYSVSAALNVLLERGREVIWPTPPCTERTKKTKWASPFSCHQEFHFSSRQPNSVRKDFPLSSQAADSITRDYQELGSPPQRTRIHQKFY